ncbi:MAG: chromate efflux transporter [Leptothrix ochracea]|uniref:chromate efflux transporter n=1 Tax=Leptothrix ochracea TaxID=735331 RepID=UPI0034E300A1
MNTPQPAVNLRDALLFWLKLGFISFGGPAGQIALMHAELVERRRWISEKRFLHALNYCMVLPGPEAQQLATYLGWLMHRTWGGVAAGVLFVLPSLFMLIGLSWVYMAWGHVPWVTGVFDGIKPAVTAIVVQAAYRIGTRTLKNAWLWAIAAAAFVAIFAANVPFPLIVLAAAVLGYLGGRFKPAFFTLGAAHAKTHAHAPVAPALIDDHGPLLAHTRFSVWRLIAVLASGALLWSAPMVAVMVWQGSAGTLAQMGWFFTKAALLTFGGAYAVLPYVWQGAVVEQGWLSGAQMIDGLALGETTPGPLIMVVTFVGFLGGWQSSELALWFGPEHRWLAGTVAACLVTWFTFLPSFIFILAGGPLVEATHDALHVTAPLTAITAAVVGVILNLALFFGYHVLWPQGWQGAFNAPSALIAVAAAVALLRYKRNVMHVIAACALAGWLLKTWPTLLAPWFA